MKFLSAISTFSVLFHWKFERCYFAVTVLSSHQRGSERLEKLCLLVCLCYAPLKR